MATTRAPKSTPTKLAAPKPTRPDYQIYGDSGLNRAAGYIFEEYLPELRGERGKRALREMGNDPIIAGILFAIAMMLRRLEWPVTPASDDPEAHRIADRVQAALDDMELTFPDTMAEALSFLQWGWALMEVEWKVCRGDTGEPRTQSAFDDGWISWRRWGIRAQDTLLHWRMEPDGTPSAMIQLVPYTGGMFTIPLDKCLHFKTVQRKGSPEGVSAIRPCWTPYSFKKNIQRLEAIGIERNWVGIPMATVPAEWQSPSATATQAANYAAVKSIVTNLRNDEQSGIVWPSDIDPETGKPITELTLLQTGGAPTVDTDRVIQRHNHDIARALLAGFIFLTDGAGSYALSENQTGLFSRALGAWADHMAAVITKGAIEPMMRYNGVPRAHWPALTHEETGEIDPVQMSETLLNLTQAGLIDVADADLRAWTAKSFGYPAPKVSDEQEAEAGDAGAAVKPLPVKEQTTPPTEGDAAPAEPGAATSAEQKPKAAVEPSEIAAALARFEKALGAKRGILNAEVAA